MIRRIALVTHALNGGIGSVTNFLHDVLQHSGRYEPSVILIATSALDAASVRLLAPGTWVKRPQVLTGCWEGIPFCRVGAVFTELEFQRYKPRHVLTDLLNQYDLVQVVAGTPAWAWVASQSKKPLCVFTATRIQRERASRLMKEKGARRLWTWAMTRLNDHMESRGLDRADCVFAESIYTYNNLKGIVRNDRLVIAPPGVNVDFFRPGSGKHQSYILAVGRFSDQRKNIRLLFEAYSQLLQHDASMPTLALAGTLPQAREMRYMAGLSIAERVKLCENPSQTELAELYRSAQLFVLSSDEEGLGIVILEAMASGLPVVSTRCGGPETAIVEGKTGFLTPVGNAQALADGIRRVLDDPQLQRRMGQAGRQRIEERFSIQGAGKVYLEKYDELLDRQVY